MTKIDKRTQWTGLVMLSILYLWSAVFEKIIGWSTALAQVKAHGLPFPMLLLGGGLAIELCIPPLLLFARTRGIAALVLGAYSLATALLFHDFWLGGDQAHSQLTQFLKNVALTGAFLFIYADSRLHASRVRSFAAARRPQATQPPIKSMIMKVEGVRMPNSRGGELVSRSSSNVSSKSVL